MVWHISWRLGIGCLDSSSYKCLELVSLIMS